MQYDPYKTPEVIQYIADYYERVEFDKIFNYELLHMFYWEHRMAAWLNASVIVESDVAFDTYMLFNCRKLLEFGFCLPKLYRDLNYIPHNVINKLWSELNYFIFNSNDTLYDYFDAEGEGNCRIKDNMTVECGSDNNTERIPQIVFEPRIYGFLLGFGDCLNRSGDWARARLNIKTKSSSTYHLQIHALPPRTNKLKAGYVDFIVEFNGKKIYGKDLSYLVNRVNQINIFFKSDRDVQNLTIKIDCKKDIDNSMFGCNGVIDIKSIILKEDVIPYEDKVYVISTTNICTKSFFREFLHAEEDGRLNNASLYLPKNTDEACLEKVVVIGQPEKCKGTLLAECEPNSIYKLQIGTSESFAGISKYYRLVVSDGNKFQVKELEVGKATDCYCSTGNGKYNIYLNAPQGTSIKFETVRIKKMAQN